MRYLMVGMLACAFLCGQAQADEGLVAYLPFDEVAAGDIAEDLSGNGNDASLISAGGPVMVEAGMVGNALRCVWLYGVIPDNDSLEIGSGPFTYEMWYLSNSWAWMRRRSRNRRSLTTATGQPRTCWPTSPPGIAGKIRG